MAININNLKPFPRDTGEEYELCNHEGGVIDTIPTYPLTEEERELFDETLQEKIGAFKNERTAVKMVYAFIMFKRSNPNEPWSTYQKVIDCDTNLIYSGYYLAYLASDNSGKILKKKQPVEKVVTSEPSGVNGQPRRIQALVS